MRHTSDTLHPIYDCYVIGSGPAGITLALELAMLAGLYVLVRPSPGMARAIPSAATALPLTPRARISGAIAMVLAPAVCLIAFSPVVTRMLGARTDFEATSNPRGESRKPAPCCRISATTSW